MEIAIGTDFKPLDFMETHVVIMAGGIGSRLWPVSTPGMPKQFIDLLGIGKTMIQLTVDRFRPVCDLKNFWVVTSEDYVGIVREQLAGGPGRAHSCGAGATYTAPCIAYACWKIGPVSPEANVVVTPADAYLSNEQRFSNIVRKALNFTAEGNRIVTVGNEPTCPETGYGYIFAEEVSFQGDCQGWEFKEKPTSQPPRNILPPAPIFGTPAYSSGMSLNHRASAFAPMRPRSPRGHGQDSPRSSGLAMRKRLLGNCSRPARKSPSTMP